MLFDKVVGVVAELGPAKALQAHIIFPVQILQMGMLFHQMSGKTAAHGNIGAISFEMGGLSVLSEQESATMFNDRYSTDTTDMVR
mgnify:CR=1 FL=1